MICRSKRPGRSNAGSRTSARLVPAKTTTFVVDVKPIFKTDVLVTIKVSC